MPPQLRKGKTKSIVESSRDAALLAVEVYNKPRTAFRTQSYIILMVIAWTRLFHAYFFRTIGDTYHEKKKGRYVVVDGDRKPWDLGTCIDKYNGFGPGVALSAPVEANLRLFIGLRNKIAHRHVSRAELDTILFGECQSLLNNYERQLIEWFGYDNALNEALAFSLQHSSFRTREQKAANRSVLSREVQELRQYIETYRSSMSDEVFASQEYSVKLIVLPVISNTNRSVVAVDFVNWNALSDVEKEEYEKLITLTKNKLVVHEAVNVGRLKPMVVVAKVNSLVLPEFNAYDLTCYRSVFGVRPDTHDIKSGVASPFDTNTDYCHYDEPNDAFLYTEAWVEFVARVITEGVMAMSEVRELFRQGERRDVREFGG